MLHQGRGPGLLMAITLPGLPITKSFMSIPIFVNKCYNESEENNDISRQMMATCKRVTV